MKRRSKSSPPSTKRTVAEPGTPGPFTADLARDQRQRDFPGASPASTKKSAALRKQLFHSSLVLTRSGTSANMNSSSGSSGHTALPVHRTPPYHVLDNITVDELPRFPPDHVIDDITVDELPRAARVQRERDPPDLHDVVTQQTEILAGMLAELLTRTRTRRTRTSRGPELRLETSHPSTGNVVPDTR